MKPWLLPLIAALAAPIAASAETAPPHAAVKPVVAAPATLAVNPADALKNPPRTVPSVPTALPPPVTQPVSRPAMITIPAEPSAPAIATLHVSGTDPQIAQAEIKALADGQSRAFAQIIRAREPERAAGILAKVTDADRAALLKSVSAQNEMRRAGRYEADVSYAFDGAKIEALLTESKGLVPELSNDALLVLPVYDTGTQLLLFEPQNQWRQVFDTVAAQEGRGRLIVPFGDPKDKLMVDANAVAAADRAKLAELARRYGAANLVLATIKVSANAPHHTVELRLRRPGQPADQVEPVITTQTGPSETDDALLARAARDAAVRLREGTNRFSLFGTPESTKLKGQVVRAEYVTSRDWASLREQMKGLPGVDFSDIGAISAGFAQLTLYYRGDLASIRHALERRGLNVADTGTYWTVKLK